MASENAARSDDTVPTKSSSGNESWTGVNVVMCKDESQGTETRADLTEGRDDNSTNTARLQPASNSWHKYTLTASQSTEVIRVYISSNSGGDAKINIRKFRMIEDEHIPTNKVSESASYLYSCHEILTIGLKGISLTVDELMALGEALPDLQEILRNKGVTLSQFKNHSMEFSKFTSQNFSDAGSQAASEGHEEGDGEATGDEAESEEDDIQRVTLPWYGDGS